MGAVPSPWQPPPDSDAGTFATRSVAIVTKQKENIQIRYERHMPL